MWRKFLGPALVGSSLLFAGTAAQAGAIVGPPPGLEWSFSFQSTVPGYFDITGTLITNPTPGSGNVTGQPGYDITACYQCTVSFAGNSGLGLLPDSGPVTLVPNANQPGPRSYQGVEFDNVLFFPPNPAVGGYFDTFGMLLHDLSLATTIISTAPHRPRRIRLALT